MQAGQNAVSKSKTAPKDLGEELAHQNSLKKQKRPDHSVSVPAAGADLLLRVVKL